MKTPLLLLTILFLGSVMAPAQEIIRSPFEGEDAASATVPPPQTAENLPLRTPTEIKIQPGETTIVTGSSELNGWGPPYLVIQTGGLKANPEYPAWASLIWDVEKLGFSSGIFELRWKMIPLGGKFHGANVSVSLVSPDGKELTAKLPPGKAPLRVGFTDKGMISAGDRDSGSEPIPYDTDVPYEFLMTFDLDNKTWSVEANGSSLIDNQSFPETLLSEGVKAVIQKVTITGTGVQETGVALADIFLKRR